MLLVFKASSMEQADK